MTAGMHVTLIDSVPDHVAFRRHKSAAKRVVPAAGVRDNRQEDVSP